jgi:L-alanine-DL-glutamate epimerase-like enolase superfamily enzyme
VTVERTVVAYVPDLMDRSRLPAGVVFVDSPADLARVAADVAADVVVVDLSRPGAVERLAGVRARTIGVGSHVEDTVLQAAAAAGCDEVLPRSRFFRLVADLLR